jgi:hypothetical protein
MNPFEVNQAFTRQQIAKNIPVNKADQAPSRHMISGEVGVRNCRANCAA